MAGTQEDYLDLFDYVWARFLHRIDGLDDAEWAWAPTADDAVSIRWRMQHIAMFLTQPRNPVWLGLVAPPGSPEPGSPARSADAARAEAEAAYAQWRTLLTQLTDLTLTEPIGSIAGEYARSTRGAFVLHLADELIHHTAEVALLRDIYGSSEAKAAAGLGWPSGSRPVVHS